MLAAGVTAVVLGLTGMLAGAGPAAATAKVRPAAATSGQVSAGLATLMQSYDATTGLIGTSGWWESAVALSTVETYHQATGDATYDYAMSTAFNDNKAGNFETDALDDTLWWSLAWIQAYDITGDSAYLQMAENEANYVHGYWDTTCGGGVWWSTAKTYKNAITNELFLEVTAALHNRGVQ